MSTGTRSRKAKGKAVIRPQEVEIDTQDTTGTLRDNGESSAAAQREPSIHVIDDEERSTSSLTSLSPDIEELITMEKEEAARLQEEIAQYTLQEKQEAVRGRIAELEAVESERARLQQVLNRIKQQWRTRHEAAEPNIAVESSGTRKRRGDDGIAQPRPTRIRTQSPLGEDRNDTEDPTTHGRAQGVKQKFRDLATYHGKNIKEAQAFIAGAERRFRIDQGYRFPTDTAKIDYCVLAFGTQPAARWNRYERREGIGRTTWEEFKEWLMDSILDKTNRVFAASEEYNRARQRDDQSAEAFADYLDTLELELKIVDEVSRRNTLFAKLKDEVKAEILRRDDIPPTRQGLLSLATRLENADKLATRRKEVPFSKGDHDRKTQGSNRDSHRGRPPQGSGSGSGPGSGGPATGANLTAAKPDGNRGGEPCRHCGSMGHKHHLCPDSTCFKCNKKGHYASYCPDLVRPGKEGP